MARRTAFVFSLPSPLRSPLTAFPARQPDSSRSLRFYPRRVAPPRRSLLAPAWRACAPPPSSSSSTSSQGEQTSQESVQTDNGTANGAAPDDPGQAAADSNGSSSDSNRSSSEAPTASSNGTTTATTGKASTPPSSLVDASGALQIDDGSFSPEVAPLVPRRLVRRGQKDKSQSVGSNVLRATRLSSVRTDLQSGFNSGALSTLVLLGLFGMWYWSNAAFNVLNKQALRAFPYPLTITCVQFAVATVLMASTWVLRLKKPPPMSLFILRSVLPLGVLHAAGFVLTNMSLGKVSVAFTHTVKATEPFFSVALTPSILGDVPTWGIIGSLFPIVAGVAIASATEVSFNWPGFLSALSSNLMLQSRNVLSKRLMNTSTTKKQTKITESGKVTTTSTKKRGWFRMRPLSNRQRLQLESLDNINLFTTMTLLAFLVLIPFGLLIEGLPLLSTTVTSSIQGMSYMKLMRLLVVGGVYRCLDVLSSYMILKRVSPVSHSIGNCVKRAIVIVASLIFFKTPVTSLNIIGTSLALFGVFTYSIIVSACKQNVFGPDSPFCRPIYTEEVELTEGGGI